ncbi:MAG TPA: GTP cyclohydrolase FolE2 [Candidatus Cloacimonadota bacterium]|nr:GTP cyclohydrolase FolE2 [Candidatus Cloacimonadota bacterium]
MKDKIDIQNLTDTRKITIDKVGVKNVQYPIIVEDRADRIQNTIANLDIFVELPHQYRGTHMSRFLEVLNHFHTETLINSLPEFLQELRTALKADAAYVKLTFPYFIKKVAPVSKIKSLMNYQCVFESSLRDEYCLKIGVEVPITTLCPCSKEISDFGAHSQRSYVFVSVRYQEFIWLEEIIDLVEAAASSEVYSLLKRVDEKFVTEKAYQNPAFVEDVVREITLKLQNDSRITWFRVESENLESIHNHNAFASVERNKR